MDYYLEKFIFKMGEAKRRKGVGLPPRKKRICFIGI